MKSPSARRGFPDLINHILAAVLTLLVLLTALAGPRRLLLLLLTGLLLSAALLTALLLATLLLLTGLLVWILIHRSILSNVGLKYHLDRPRPIAKTMRGGCIRSRSRTRSTLKKMCSERLGGAASFPLAIGRNRRWDAICCCGCLGYRFRFWS